jgi:RNA processing factor Prp31
MPLDYKKIEALVIEKTTEIDCLKEEIYNLKERISEITNQHESELSNL